MKTVLAAIALWSPLAACGSDSGGDTATDPAAPPGGNPMPTEAPAAPGTVHTRGLVTVMDTGRPSSASGAVAESYPPQCGGPEIRGWDWEDQRRRFDQQGNVRWGQFAVTGRWDGTTFTVTDAIPAALYDAMALEEPTVPPAGRSYARPSSRTSRRSSARSCPARQGDFADQGHVFVDVIYDDGSLQAWADEEYGENVVSSCRPSSTGRRRSGVVGRLEGQADRVDAVAVAGGGAVAVGEDVAEVGAAVGAADLDPLHAVRWCPRCTRRCR